MSLFSQKHVIDAPAVSTSAIAPGDKAEAEAELERAFRVMHGDSNAKLRLIWKPDPVQPDSSLSLELEN